MKTGGVVLMQRIAVHEISFRSASFAHKSPTKTHLTKTNQRLKTIQKVLFLQIANLLLGQFKDTNRDTYSSDSRATGKYDRSAIRRPTHGMSQFDV